MDHQGSAHGEKYSLHSFVGLVVVEEDLVGSVEKKIRIEVGLRNQIGIGSGVGWQ